MDQEPTHAGSAHIQLQATRTEPIVLVSSPTRSVRASSAIAAGFMAYEYRLSAKWLELLK